MTIEEGAKVVAARHLEATANAVKNFTVSLFAQASVSGGGETYTLPTANATTKGGVKIGNGLAMDGETLNVTLSAGTSDEVFTGATSSVAGTSGNVPQPQAGDQDRFLRGDGVWARVQQSGSSDYIIGSTPSNVEGGLWKDTINDTPVLKLRHGDYEYNFNYDNMTYLEGASSPLVSVTPDTYVIGTASSTVDGGIWYTVTNDVPQLKMHNGSFDYGFNHDSITYKGGNRNLVAYLPFDMSATADACGNTWATDANDTRLNTSKKKFGTSSLSLAQITGFLKAENVLDINAEKWTFDTWIYFNGNHPIKFGNDTTLSATKGISIADGKMRIANAAGNGWGINENFSWGLQYKWQHIAIVKNGNTLMCFTDGVLKGTWTLTSEIADGGFVGFGVGDGSFWDSMRFFEGVALWDSDFTPPIASDYT